MGETRGWFRRLLTLVVGCVCGVAVTLIYVVSTRQLAPATASLPDDPSVTVILGERFLTAAIHRALAATGEDKTLTNARVAAIDGALVVRGSIDLFGQVTALSATLRPKLVGGQLALQIVSTELGALPIPADHMLEQEIDQRLNAMLFGLPVVITGVEVRQKKGLIVTCRVDLGALVPH